MKKFGKKSIIVAAMMLMLGGAVYVNWMIAGGDLSLSELVGGTASSDKHLGEAELVGGTVSGVTSGTGTSTDKGGVLNELRLDRTQKRDASIATLKTVTENAELTEEERKSAVDTLAALVKAMETEQTIETLVKAKGFTDCVASVSDGSVTVTVQSKEKLTGSHAAQIKDIAVSATNYSGEMIKIVEVG